LNSSIHTIETLVSVITIHENGVGQMHFKDGIILDVPGQMEHLSALIKITNGKKTPFVVTAGKHVNITPEARDNAIVIEDISPVCATAVVVQNLAYRLIADFYMKINRPKTPYKVFTDQKSAFSWCSQYINSDDENGFPEEQTHVSPNLKD
jgi:hypothetical protein